MKKAGTILLALLITISLTGCSGQNSSKTQSEQLPSIPLKPLTSQIADQSNANKNPAGEAASSKQLSEVDSTLQSLNDVLKNLDDVSSEELIIPTP